MRISTVLLTLGLLLVSRPVLALDDPPEGTQAAYLWVGAGDYRFGYDPSTTPWRSFLEVRTTTPTPIRFYLDKVEEVVCLDCNVIPHRSFCDPGRPPNPTINDPGSGPLFIVLDCQEWQVRPTVTLTFRDACGKEIDYQVHSLDGHYGQMVRHDPR